MAGGFQLSVTLVVVSVAEVNKLPPFRVGDCTELKIGRTGPFGNEVI